MQNQTTTPTIQTVGHHHHKFKGVPVNSTMRIDGLDWVFHMAFYVGMALLALIIVLKLKTTIKRPYSSLKL